MFKQEEQKLNRNVYTTSHPLVVIFTALGEGESLCARLVASLTNMEVRCKSLHFNLGIANTGLEVRCKSLHFNLGIANTGLEVRYKNA